MSGHFTPLSCAVVTHNLDGRMSKLAPHKDREITIRDLYPNLSEEQLREAEEVLDRYIELAVRMYRRIKADPEAYAQFNALTDKNRASRINDTQSHHPNSSQT